MAEMHLPSPGSPRAVELSRWRAGDLPGQMMRQSLDTLRVATKGRGFYEITRDVQRRVAQAGVLMGLCTLHLQHTSASLLIQENADPDVRRDFERFFARLVPDGDALFVHTAEGDDDMPAHVRTALTTVNLSVPVADGQLCLGTWQGIYVWEHRRAPHTRFDCRPRHRRRVVSFDRGAGERRRFTVRRMVAARRPARAGRRSLVRGDGPRCPRRRGSASSPIPRTGQTTSASPGTARPESAARTR